MNIDVFNGDADGICALIQFRLANPAESILITGVKRDIDLLRQANAHAGDLVTVLDVSMDRNRHALLNLLELQVDVFYVDHHYSGQVPSHSRLKALIDTDANVCTSLLMDEYLGHRYAEWAITAAFGDNLGQVAEQLARKKSLSTVQVQTLRHLGVCINYNAYGSCVEDLYFAPDSLYRLLVKYETPFEFIQDNAEIYRQLQDGYTIDMQSAWRINAEYQSSSISVYVMPDEKWARRVNGVWSNELANKNPNIAHAVLTYNRNGGFQVSVRAPLNNKNGADELCACFSGGGRKAAAGIDHLEYVDLAKFIKAFESYYS